MFKRDMIFWAAAGIFISGVILFGITQDQMWLFILAGSYLLRPTLASLNVKKALMDERQMSIQYRSGNIAFAIMIISCIAMAIVQSYKNDHSWEFFSAVVAIGLAAKALSNVILAGNFREAATRIIMTVGFIVILFVTLENGFSLQSLIESAPGWGIVGIGWLSKKIPRVIGAVIIIISIALLFLILSKGITIGQIITSVLVSIPLIIAGVSLIIGDRIQEVDNGDVAVRP